MIKDDVLIIFDYVEGIFDEVLFIIVYGWGVGSYFVSYVVVNKFIDGLVFDGVFNNIFDFIVNMVFLFLNLIILMKLYFEVYLM